MNGIHEVTGSIPVWSTNFPNPIRCDMGMLQVMLPQ